MKSDRLKEIYPQLTKKDHDTLREFVCSSKEDAEKFLASHNMKPDGRHKRSQGIEHRNK
jgi:hypothetical protein